MRRGVCTKCGAEAIPAARGHFSRGGERAVRITASRMVRATLVDT